MQKLILGFLLSLGLIVSSFANEIDLISLATNGAYNEKSKGVKVLNDEEMSEVIGGAYLTGIIPKHYGVVNNFGQNIYYTAYYQLALENSDLPYFNLGSNYYAAVATTYDFRTGRVTDEVVKINKYNSSDVRTINFQSNVRGRIYKYNQVRDWIMLDKKNIQYFK